MIVERERVEREREEVVWYVYLLPGTCLVRYKCCSHILAALLSIIICFFSVLFDIL